MTRASPPFVAVRAETHPPGYAFHKYWARKPHNVVRRALEACGVGAGDVVVDPFCGSGVPLSEAAALGATCIGFDVNPIAVELTRATLRPPDAERFRTAFAAVLDDAERALGDRFRERGRAIRYAVHATVVACPGCDVRVASDRAARRGRSYACPRCGGRLAFNLENLRATRVVKVVLADGTEEARDEERDAIAEGRDGADRVDHPFEPNARILAFRGMRTRDLFTRRNFAALAYVAERIASLPDDVRGAASLTLTAAAAQCSRLVAHRNGLTTGGPAWTVPGFWVPPLHLETNPLAHLRARMERTARGLAHLRGLAGRDGAHVVREGDAAKLLDALPAETRAAAAFLDPPYGDSVPYLEFSTMWNSLLGRVPDPSLDIAVSDRARGDGGWDAYEAGLTRIVRALRRVLRDDARLVVTFNNRDVRAWKALLASLQSAKLRCAAAFYQPPAVVSTKAQLAREGSYVGDVYAIFAPSSAPLAKDVAPITAALRGVKRRDEASLRRAAMIEALRANVAAARLDEIAV